MELSENVLLACDFVDISYQLFPIVLYFTDKVYAVGGHDGKEHLSSMEAFDSKTNRWKTLASMARKR